MKAFLLAAGLGTRLRPLTDTIPKCLVPILGKPLLAYWLENLAAAGVSEVLINIHYLPEAVHSFLSETRLPEGLKVFTVHEPRLLGTAGTIRANRDFVAREESFLVCYADNFSLIDIKALVAAHQQHGLVGTIALFRVENPREAGIAVLDAGGVITQFVEKPEVPVDNLANAGIYVLRNSVLGFISDSEVTDFGHDVFPRLANRLVGVPSDAYHLDIGTPAKFEQIQREAPRLLV